jgi:hypothetical protein
MIVRTGATNPDAYMSDIFKPSGAVPATPSAAPPQAPPPPEEEDNDPAMAIRLDRLAGEPAPDITAEEFARLQNSDQGIHFDSRGRVRATRHEESDPGVSLRKRRAWYAA